MLDVELLPFILKYEKSYRTTVLDINKFIKYLWNRGVDLSPLTLIRKLDRLAENGFLLKRYSLKNNPFGGFRVRKKYYVINSVYIEYYLYHNLPQLLSDEQKRKIKNIIEWAWGVSRG